MAIFEHTDIDGDRLEVSKAPEDWSEVHRGSLAFMVTRHSNEQTSALPRHRVRDLRDALNRWLDEQQSRDPDPAGRRPEPQYSGSVAETLVRRLVAEEVARVLPLHQSPQAALRCRRCGARPDGAHEDCAGDIRACQYIRPSDPGYAQLPAEHRPQECPEYATNTGLSLCIDPGCSVPAATHAEHDPEPQAVGHPEAPGIDWTDKLGVRYEYCGGCGHSWSRHGVGAGNCNVRSAIGRGVPTECGCEAIRADQVQTLVPVECECGHAWVVHGQYGLRGCGVHGCGCSRAVPRSTS